MDTIVLILIGLSLLAFGLRIWAPAQYLAVGWLVEAGVRAAEQRYKETAGQVDRRALARHQIRRVLMWLFRIDLDKDKYKELRQLTEWLIDAAITRLPKTHTDTEDPAQGGVS